MITILFYLSLILLFGFGVFLIVGTIKGVKVLVDPIDNWYAQHSYIKFLKSMGKRAVYYYHIFLGFVFILSAIFIFFYILSY
jgi:hypothetical protein